MKMDIKKGQEIELVINNSIYGGKAVGYIESHRVITDRGIPGQKLLARVKKRRPGLLEAKTIKVLECSEKETQDACIHAVECGGCSMQGVEYQYQVELKNQQVYNLFRSEGLLVKKWLNPIMSPLQSEYRNKMEFTFGNEYKEGPLTLGMHRRGHRFDIIDTYECRLIDSDFRKLRNLTAEFFRDKQLKPYHKISREGVLRHLVLRKGYYSGEVMVHLITTSEVEETVIREWSSEIVRKNFGGIIKSIFWTKNDSVADAVKSDETILLYGEKNIVEILHGLIFRITPFSFFQTNSAGANVLYDVIKKTVQKTDGQILDLYCGLGTIAQILAQMAESVTGIDIVEEAIEQAKESAVENNIKNCGFIAGDVKEKLHELHGKPDLLVIDPPRPGVHPKAMSDLLYLESERILYVSCNPKTLVKNLKQSVENGYSIEWVQCVDLFPSTNHVEVVTLLTS
ncbi:MAG: 23S rRNA (uracil(1939)-C(5))-methyltransferase RlmD [Tindallia sp. MSAO_Bac2]|nr:MAG: 23S rRNA (uracil(1939)-C(5))-methyltransferase RlmD [Tindallia sp. MSAO_Bac2]